MTHHANLSSPPLVPGKLSRYPSVYGTPNTLLESPATNLFFGSAFPALLWQTSRAVAIAATTLGTALCLLSPPTAEATETVYRGVAQEAPWQRALTYQTTGPNLLVRQPAAPFYQTNWPVPRGWAPLNLSFSDSFKLPLTTHAPPYLTTDWPVPKAKKSVDGFTLEALALDFADAVRPFVQPDWPNPRGHPPRLDWRDSFKLPLTTHKPFAQTDWPVPPGPRRARDYSITAQNPLLNPPSAVAEATETAYRGVVEETPWRQALAYQTAGPNLVIRAVVQDPFKQTDWPVPRGAKRHHDWPAGLTAALLTSRPFVQSDWPLPRGPKPVVADWEDSFKLPLTTHKGTAQYDWPNPLPPRRNEPLGWFSDGLARTTVFAYPDTIHFDWPNPRGPQPLNRGWTDSFKLPLTTHKGTAQYDWPNPLPPRRNEQLGWFNEGLARTTVVVYPATITFDWPNPRGDAPLNVGFSDSFKLPLTTHKPPFTQYDWPVPKGAKSDQPLDWSFGSTIYATPIFPEQRQFDWPVPRGYQPLNRGWTDSFKLPLTTHKPPFTQYDWPVPKGKKSSQPLSWSDNLKLTLAFIRPFSQSDWPVPAGKRGTISLKTWTDAFKLPLTTHRPHRQHDWPLAVRLRLKVVDWIDHGFRGRFEPPPAIALDDIDACRTVDVVALDRGYTVPAKVTVNVRFTEDEVTPTPKQDVTVKPLNKTTDVDCK